jgi:anaerobic C4-dicarboxylate transporter
MEHNQDRLIDVIGVLFKKCNIFIALILFALVIILLSDFTTNHVLMPLKLAEVNGTTISPTQEGYLAIGACVAVTYIIADLAYKFYSN